MDAEQLRLQRPPRLRLRQLRPQQQPLPELLDMLSVDRTILRITAHIVSIQSMMAVSTALQEHPSISIKPTIFTFITASKLGGLGHALTESKTTPTDITSIPKVIR